MTALGSFLSTTVHSLSSPHVLSVLTSTALCCYTFPAVTRVPAQHEHGQTAPREQEDKLKTYSHPQAHVLPSSGGTNRAAGGGGSRWGGETALGGGGGGGGGALPEEVGH